MKTDRFFETKWHDNNLKITNHGLSCMRGLIVIGLILGLLLGSFTSMLVYESLKVSTEITIKE